MSSGLPGCCWNWKPVSSPRSTSISPGCRLGLIACVTVVTPLHDIDTVTSTAWYALSYRVMVPIEFTEMTPGVELL